MLLCLEEISIAYATRGAGGHLPGLCPNVNWRFDCISSVMYVYGLWSHLAHLGIKELKIKVYVPMTDEVSGGFKADSFYLTKRICSYYSTLQLQGLVILEIGDLWVQVCHTPDILATGRVPCPWSVYRSGGTRALASYGSDKADLRSILFQWLPMSADMAGSRDVSRANPP